jgi:hypothetical protein
MNEEIQKLLIDCILWWEQENGKLSEEDKVLIVYLLNTDKLMKTFLNEFIQRMQENSLPTKDYEIMSWVCHVARENM